MSRYRIRKQRKCAMCGRVGTRMFMRERDGSVCSNVSACVIRCCDKAFLPPKPILVTSGGGGGTVSPQWIKDILQNVHLYGVVSDIDSPDMAKATIEIVPTLPPRTRLSPLLL